MRTTMDSDFLAMTIHICCESREDFNRLREVVEAEFTAMDEKEGGN